jgi:transposase
MAFREVPMFEVREVLRLWLGGEGLRSVARLSSVDRKTVRRYVDAAIEAGVTADGGVGQLTDEVLGAVVEIVRPHRADGRHGEAWAALVTRREQVEAWVKADVAGVKICELLARDGVVVPERTVQRFVAGEFGPRRGQGSTVRVADGEPGGELQIDFAKLGLLHDPESGRRRVCHALIFTAVVSRHMFVWLSFTQTTETVIAGCEAAWRFFGGVFKVLVPDNLTPVVTKADGLEPRFNEAFVEYAQARGFVIDPARVRTPTDKPRVERMVQFVLAMDCSSISSSHASSGNGHGRPPAARSECGIRSDVGLNARGVLADRGMEAGIAITRYPSEAWLALDGGLRGWCCGMPGERAGTHRHQAHVVWPTFEEMERRAVFTDFVPR